MWWWITGKLREMQPNFQVYRGKGLLPSKQHLSQKVLQYDLGRWAQTLLMIKRLKLDLIISWQGNACTETFLKTSESLGWNRKNLSLWRLLLLTDSINVLKIYFFTKIDYFNNFPSDKALIPGCFGFTPWNTILSLCWFVKSYSFSSDVTLLKGFSFFDLLVYICLWVYKLETLYVMKVPS